MHCITTTHPFIHPVPLLPSRIVLSHFIALLGSLGCIVSRRPPWYRALQGRSRGLLPLARFRACSLPSCSGLSIPLLQYNPPLHSTRFVLCRRLKGDRREGSVHCAGR
ncbi:hypothetical protein EXIGLDRAFT_186942 [Exidia glandulosa HHB12029]|uniref:Uncharacterized protein n=1 Tax=Exidia glandulosa HHB12029 TaxID=1314781 RepID=A0A165EZF8_EXIGL|nr:hypothetical protein EXIGLDRAFT_186942 [Exidia glandulosa HHB12029]